MVPPWSRGAPTSRERERANSSDCTGAVGALVVMSPGVLLMPKKSTPTAVSSVTNPTTRSVVYHQGRDSTPLRMRSMACDAVVRVVTPAADFRVRARLIRSDEFQIACHEGQD